MFPAIATSSPEYNPAGFLQFLNLLLGLLIVQLKVRVSGKKVSGGGGALIRWLEYSKRSAVGDVVHQ